VILPFKDKTPQIAEDAFIAPTAVIIGDVIIGSKANIWYGAVIRGDINQIIIGEKSSVQDNCVLHCNYRNPTIVGNQVIVGHGAIMEGCIIEDGCMIGMNATVLSGAKIGAGSIVAAGAVVKENGVYPIRSLLAGIPAELKRELTEEQANSTLTFIENYQRVMAEYKLSSDS
jgi:carbonic anhydrase/acetyltransferase-like protein (isoleucine patch superfamily)